MKFSHILPFVALGSALVVPSEEVFREIEVEANHRHSGWYEQLASSTDELVSDGQDLIEKYWNEASETAEDTWEQVTQYSSNALDAAYEDASNAAAKLDDKFSTAASNLESWVDAKSDELNDAFSEAGHGHHNPNRTVYQLIAESKYTTKLAGLINKFDDIVDALNSTKANYTVFAPIDKAFEKIPDDAPEPSDEQLKKFLTYHVIPDFYPAKRVLVSHTAPTLLKSDHLGSEPEPQRLTFRIGLNGLSVNFYSRVVAINIFGTNGVIHGVSTPIFPPPGTIETIDFLPATFSTLELGLGKTGLLDKLNNTDHPGGTFFAPSNSAFERLGPRVNAFLFSKAGLKYLKALLEYHVVPARTLYSDAFYDGSSSEELHAEDGRPVHYDFPTFLEDKTIAVDVARYGPFIEIKVNAFSRVSIQDGVADDGVIQTVNNVIIPPRTKGEEAEYWSGEELSVEDLIERLEGVAPKSDL